MTFKELRKWFTRDGSLNCTVGNRLSSRGWRRTYLAWAWLFKFFHIQYYRVERATCRVVALCPRVDEIPDTYRFKSKIKTYWRWDGTCSSCGSISPDQFFSAIAAGAVIGPTDKSYKVYVEGKAAPKVSGACKFYFQHLSKEQKKRFIDLVNAKTIKIGMPGYFHVLPYFMTKIDKAAE